MDKVGFDIVVLGADVVGATFTKEFARFLSCFKSEKKRVHLSVVDEKDIDETDVLSNAPFYSNDIGWNRAAVLGEYLVSYYPELSRRIRAYAGPVNQTLLQYICTDAGDFWYGSQERIPVICDCTGENYVSREIRKLWKQLTSCIVLTTKKGQVSFAAKFSGIVAKDYVVSGKGSKEKMTSIKEQASYAMLTKVVQILTYDILDFKDIIFKKQNTISCSYVKNRKQLLVLVGTGGTGGNFAKEFAGLMQRIPDVRMLLIDGDRVEEGNMIRQPFREGNVQQNKADGLKNGLLLDYPELEGRICAYPFYLDNVSDLQEALALNKAEDESVIVVGAVDNHRARQVLHQYYEASQDIIYMDSGNEFDYGEIVTGIRRKGKELAKPRAFYFPDILTDKSPSASEQSCGMVNLSAPQHQVTNLIAANILLKNMEELFLAGRITVGVTYFDTFAHIREVSCSA